MSLAEMMSGLRAIVPVAFIHRASITHVTGTTTDGYGSPTATTTTTQVIPCYVKTPTQEDYTLMGVTITANEVFVAGEYIMRFTDDGAGHAVTLTTGDTISQITDEAGTRIFEQTQSYRVRQVRTMAGGIYTLARLQTFGGKETT